MTEAPVHKRSLRASEENKRIAAILNRPNDTSDKKGLRLITEAIEPPHLARRRLLLLLLLLLLPFAGCRGSLRRGKPDDGCGGILPKTLWVSLRCVGQSRLEATGVDEFLHVPTLLGHGCAKAAEVFDEMRAQGMMPAHGLTYRSRIRLSCSVVFRGSVPVLGKHPPSTCE